MVEDKIFFKGHKLDYSGHVIGAFPSVDVIHQQTEDAIRRMTANVNQRIIEYCLKINIDPDVLLKQKAEIELLLMKNDLLQEENKKLKEAAEEWHYVKNGDLPKENQLVLLYRENPNGANIALTYWYKSYVNDKVIAWKEIMPPKESD